MLTEATVRQFADDWMCAWNSHDLDAILSHYAPEIVLTSPVAARLLNDPSGVVTGPGGVAQLLRARTRSLPEPRL